MSFTVVSHPKRVSHTQSMAGYTFLYAVSKSEFYFVCAKLPEGFTGDARYVLGKKDPSVHIHASVIGRLEGKFLYLESAGEGIVLLSREGSIGKVLASGGKVRGDVAKGDIVAASIQGNQAFLTDVLKNIATAGSESDDALIIKVTAGEDDSRINSQTRNIKSLFVNRILALSVVFRALIERVVKFLKPEDARGKLRRTLLIIALGLAVLLLVSVMINADRNRNSQKSKQLADALVVVEEQYEEAVSVSELNPVRARELLASAKLTLSPFLSEFGKKTSQYTTVSQWLEKIGSAEVAAYQIYKLTTVPEFFDLSLIRAGAVGNKMAAYNSTKAIVDVTNKAVYTLATDTKQGAVVAGGSYVGDKPTVAIHGLYVYGVGNDGVSRTEIKNASTQTVIPKDETWGEIVDIAAFAGNLYLLDKTRSTIHKYIATQDGFTPKTSYLNPGINIDLGSATRIMIDGSVWVATAQRIWKFERGAPAQFELSGFSDTIPTIDAIFTSDEEKFLYILDKSLSRIIVFDKDGVYQSQYQWEQLKTATDIVASEKEKKLFVLVGNKIYGIDLK